MDFFLCFCLLELETDSPVEGGLYEVPGVLENVGLTLVLGKDRVEHELLGPVVPVHLDGGVVHETDGPLAVLVDLVPYFFFWYFFLLLVEEVFTFICDAIYPYMYGYIIIIG